MKMGVTKFVLGREEHIPSIERDPELQLPPIREPSQDFFPAARRKSLAKLLALHSGTGSRRNPQRKVRKGQRIPEEKGSQPIFRGEREEFYFSHHGDL
jgi:hypothetical protein